MHVALECPHCRRRGHTPRIVQPGTRMRCPKCRQIFRVLPDEEALVETVRLDALAGESTGLLIEDAPLPRWHRSPTSAGPAVYALADRPRPPGPPSTRTIFTSPRKEFTPSRTRPFEQERSFVGVLAITPVVIAVTAFVYWYAGQFKDLRASVAEPAEQRQTDLRMKRDVPAKIPEIPAPTAVPPRMNERVRAPLPLEQGSYRMSVRDVAIRPVKINNRETPTFHLTVGIEVSNLSGQPVEYRGWHDARTYCTLKGPLNRNYRMFLFARSELPEGCVRTVRLQPRGAVRDMIVFENPGLATIGSLELDLPPLPYGASQPFRFTIPGSMIRRSAQSVGMVSSAAPILTPSLPPTRREVGEAERIRARPIGNGTTSRRPRGA